MEVISGLRNGSELEQHSIGDGAEGESRVEDEAKESRNDTEMTPCVATEFMDDASESVFYDVKVVDDEVVDGTELPCSVEVLSSNSELQPWLDSHVKDAGDAAESKPCCEIQSREVVNRAALEPCKGARAKEVLKEHELLEEHCLIDLAKEAQNGGDREPKGVLNDSEMDPCEENHVLEQLDDGKVELCSNSNEVKEAHSNPGFETCHKDQVKEPTNDDVHSEVSNPNISPKQVTSSFTISSQPHDVLGGERGGCGEITSGCSWNSCADGNFHDEEHSKCKLESVSPARVDLEIPKHVRPTGIRKITFKFSERKEDCDAEVKPLVDGKFNDLYDNQISLSTADGLSIDGFRNDDWNALENSKVRSSMVDGECLDPRSASSCAPNMELRMSKKIIPDIYPSNVKKLLSTGILEGARVKYICMSGEMELPGIIRSGGYLCGCCVCNFSKVVSAYEFELHAGSKTRHPNNHVYLENGKPIHCIVEELKSAPLGAVDSVIKAVAGSSVNEEYYQIWRASLEHGNGVAYADSLHESHYSGMSYSTTRNVYMCDLQKEIIESLLHYPTQRISLTIKEEKRAPFKRQKCMSVLPQTICMLVPVRDEKKVGGPSQLRNWIFLLMYE